MSLRAALLGLLAEGPATGYALIKDFDVASSVIWPAPKGEVYRELAKLEKEGFAARGAEMGARRQREWRITAKGRAELKRWLESAPDYTLRYEPILRAAFFSTLRSGEVRELVERDRAFFAAELKTLKDVQRGGGGSSRARYGLPMAVAFYEAMLKWCDAADAIARRS